MRICIGIPCYQGVPAETLEDYMRFAFYLGRHYPEHEFFLAIKSKSEQFRARNAIVEASFQMDCQYLLMLDDDHVLDWQEKRAHEPSTRRDSYEFLRTLIGHMETAEKAAIVGALYYHRGGDCRPVVMKEGKQGGYYWMRDDEITGDLQEVAVTGGGCMLVDMNLFSRISSPWFEPEFDLGTDLQICKKAREQGFRVYCDTGVIIGHVLSKREIVSPKNRHRLIAESTAVSNSFEGMDKTWTSESAWRLYQEDVREYLGMGHDDIIALAGTYSMEALSEHEGNLEAYYASKGKEQLARQYWFHGLPELRQEMDTFLAFVNPEAPGHGCDYACGSAPIGFELALRGQVMDFVDIDGAGAYEFTKWRAQRRKVDCNFGFTGGPYDYVLLMDALEHLPNWEEVLDKIVAALKPPEGNRVSGILTNYFQTFDFKNPEHVSMDHAAVRDFLTSRGVYPVNKLCWLKRDLDFMSKESE